MPIEKLPSGRYRVQVMAGKRPDGKRRRLARTLPHGATMDDARQEELLLRVHAGQTTAEGDMSDVSSLVRMWIDRGEEQRAASTQYRYRGIARNWLDGSELGNMSVSKVRTADIERHYREILSLKPRGERPKGTTGPATLHQVQAMLSGAFRYAVRMSWIATNPASDVDSLPKLKPKTEATTPAEFRAALDAAEDIQLGLRAFILVLGTTGCRKSEALAMRWSNFDGNSVLIGGSIAAVPTHGVFLKETKTEVSRRIAVGPSVLEAVGELKSIQAENCELAGVPFDPEGYVWSADALGQDPWRPDTAGKWVQKAGIRRPHMLRHMVATELLGAGVIVGEVSQRLGHSSSSMTLNVYQHVQPATDHTSASIMENLADGG